MNTHDAKAIEFRTFWDLCPLKVGKLATEREYWKARRIASAEAILSGLETYKRTKPEWQAWCHPRTWLHQGRWLDEAPARQLDAKQKRHLQSLEPPTRPKQWWD